MFSARPKPRRVVLPGSFLVLGLVALLSTPAAGQDGRRCIIKGKQPGRGQLQQLVPSVQIYSYNGRVFQMPTPVASRRTRDPMVIRGNNLHPDSTLAVQRQRHSRSLASELKGRLSCKQLPALAEKALVWSEKVEVKPDVRSRADAFAVIVKEPEKVFWPNSGARVTGTDRDGRQLKEQRLVVGGMNATNEQVFNHATQQMQNIRQSGDALPSSRAWTINGNLLVSQPVRDVAAIGRGKHYLKLAQRYRASHDKMTRWAEKTQADIAAGTFDADPAKKARMQRGLQKVQQKLTQNALTNAATQYEQQGKALVEGGKQLRSIVMSVAGTPIGAQIAIANSRLQGEGARAVTGRGKKGNITLWSPTYSGAADLETGSFRAEVGGIAKDTLSATVTMPAVGNRSVGSQTTLSFRIPDPKTEKPDLTMGHASQKRHRIKFYQVAPISQETVHDQPRQ